jgi:hypothetical protein
MSIVAKSFNSDGFNPVLPFSAENPLEAEVQSDHAEISIKTPDNHIINAWNISNPSHHHYFKSGPKPPFFNSHLYVEKPFVDGKLVERLERKVADQIDTIAQRFVSGKVNIQIVPEGYETFYKRLSEKIRSYGQGDFQIVSFLDNKPTNWSTEKNVTGILVDTSRFSILDKGIIDSKYLEEGDFNKEKAFYLPYVHLKDKRTDREIVVSGVHITGCDSHDPKTGLETLAKTMLQLNAKTAGSVDVLAAGDFNTTPETIRKYLGSTMSGAAFRPVVLQPTYPTHINPRSEAAIYDQAVLLPCREAEHGYEVLGEDSISPASQALVTSILRTRTRYLQTVQAAAP